MNEPDFSEVINAIKFLEDYDKSWAVCGGWAIDLYLNRITRPHKDVDFVVLRNDQLIIQEHLYLQGWCLEKAFQGQLVPWQKGEWIDPPVHIIWCKNPKASPEFIEILFDEVENNLFLYRRDTSVTLLYEKMIISSPSGIPVLAPELVLLYKSVRPEDSFVASDFQNFSPKLSFESRNWLAAALKKLHPDHPWLKNLS